MKQPSTSQQASNMKPSQSKVTCSTCGQVFIFEKSKAPPFCSERCQMIDLGRWLDEEISIPFEGEAGNVPVEYRDEDGKVEKDERSQDSHV
ncbi:DNA gyrase inhibitor YacG [Novipirellula aureliae]|nr:DNA gyrase inhibitor YacG [Novipirellula aureliae]